MILFKETTFIQTSKRVWSGLFKNRIFTAWHFRARHCILALFDMIRNEQVQQR